MIRIYCRLKYSFKTPNKMKNLLKSVMLLALTLIIYNCDTESVNDNISEESQYSELSDQNVFNCDNVSSVAKFVNNSNNPTDFAIYTESGEMLAIESNLEVMGSSDLKSFNSQESVELHVRSSDINAMKIIKFKSCRLITIIVNEQNKLEIIKTAY